MLTIYGVGPQGLLRLEPTSAGAVPPEAIWLDLIEPTPDEEKLVEDALRVDVPTREEMREIEASNRLYEEGGALYMTATIVTKLDTDLPESTQATFILSGSRLVTNRYVDPLPFRRFVAFAEKHPAVCLTPGLLLAGLLESIVNRIADVMERIGADLDAVSTDVFASARGGRRRRPSPQRDLRRVLGSVGQSGDTISKTRESLVSLGRLLIFAQQSGNHQFSNEVRMRLRVLSRDVLALSDHASFLANKLSFMLDAMLGMVSIDQNNILKIFSVVTVFLLPPSVIAAFYGMNFQHIPLLHETWGVWIALGLMALSSFLPYLVFKRRGWL